MIFEPPNGTPKPRWQILGILHGLCVFNNKGRNLWENYKLFIINNALFFFFFDSVRQKQLKMFLREVTLCSILTFDKMLSCHCADFDQRKKVPLSAFFFFFCTDLESIIIFRRSFFLKKRFIIDNSDLSQQRLFLSHFLTFAGPELSRSLSFCHSAPVLQNRQPFL